MKMCSPTWSKSSFFVSTRLEFPNLLKGAKYQPTRKVWWYLLTILRIYKLDAPCDAHASQEISRNTNKKPTIFMVCAIIRKELSLVRQFLWFHDSSRNSKQVLEIHIVLKHQSTKFVETRRSCCLNLCNRFLSPCIWYLLGWRTINASIPSRAVQ